MSNQGIALAYGDGIGPEIMESVLDILRETAVEIGSLPNMETVNIGLEMYEKGTETGITDEAWKTIFRNKALLKAPITTPQGGGYRSINVELRKRLGLYANVRHCRSYYPIVNKSPENMDMLIVRENEEDIYSGIEYRLTNNSYTSLKLITESASERICRYAFELAKSYNRKKVTCMSKDNIMKMTDGTFHKAFDKIAKEYKDIESNHYIIDIGAARIATAPETFDVIVSSNLYGDIISDIAADISGSVGMVASSNIGPKSAMFEAIHGSAPDIAGQNIANPSGLLQGAIQMLLYLGYPKHASTIQNAWLHTIESGVHTKDIYNEEKSSQLVTTTEFTQAIIENIRKNSKPSQYFKEESYNETDSNVKDINVTFNDVKKKELVGVDIYLDAKEHSINEIVSLISETTPDKLACKAISYKGLVMWPTHSSSKSDEIDNNNYDLLCCRFCSTDITHNLAGVVTITEESIITLLSMLNEKKLQAVKMVKLYSFDDVPGFYKTSS